MKRKKERNAQVTFQKLHKSATASLSLALQPLTYKDTFCSAARSTENNVKRNYQFQKQITILREMRKKETAAAARSVDFLVNFGHFSAKCI